MRHAGPRFILILGLIVFLSPSVFSQIRWEKTKGPYGGTVRAIAVDDYLGIVYAGTYGNGVFRSLDRATTWQPINIGIENTYVRSLAVDNTTGVLYAGTNYSGIYRSADQGTSWSLITTADIADVSVQAILVIPGGVLFAGTSDGIYRSVDYGTTWIPVNLGLTDLNVLSLAQSHSGAIVAGTSSGMFRSSDYGETWYPSGNLIAGKICYSIIVHPTLNIIYIGASDGMYLSVDDGNTYILSGLVMDNLNVVALCRNPIDGTIYAGTDLNGVLASTDGGGNWTPVSANIPATNTRSLVVDKTGAVYAGFLGIGVYRSTNNGASWSEQNYGLTGTTIYCLKHQPIGGLFAGTPYNGLYHTTDYGKNWLHVGNEIRTTTINSIMVHPNGSLFAGTRRGVYLSTDYGDTWTASNNGIPSDDPRVNIITMNTAGIMYAQSTGGVYRSSDTGKTWTTISSTLPSGYIYSLAVTQSGALFVIDSTFSIYRSTNEGNTWTQVGTGITTKILWNLSSFPLTSTTNVLLVGTDIGIFRSTDNGDSWVQVLSGPDINVFEMGPRGFIFCGTSNGGVYISDDNGLSWYQTNQDLTSVFIWSFGFTSNGMIFAGTDGSGVWRGIPTFPVISPPIRVQFQSVNVGASDNQSIKIQNVGGEALQIDSIRIGGANPNDFSISNAAISILLQQDETATLTLHFTPTMGGVRDANLLLYSNDPTLEIASVPLQGIGLQGPKIAVQDTLPFGTVMVGLYSDLNLMIQNKGSSDLRIDSMRVQMTTGDVSEFQLLNVVYPLIIKNGVNGQITLRWTPKSAGLRDGLLILYDNDPTKSIAQVVIRGTAVQGPKIAVQDTLSFGDVVTGLSADQNLTIQNMGSSDLHIDSMKVQISAGNISDLQLVSVVYPFIITNGTSRQVTLRWSPKSGGILNGVLIIYSNDLLKPSAQVVIRGTGVLGPKIAVQDTLSFGTVITGLDADQNFSIQNTGSVNLRVDSIRVQMSTGSASEFKLVSVVYPISITDGSNQQVTLRWSPKSDGLRYGMLLLYSNDLTKPVAQIIIRGTAVVDNTPPAISNVSVPVVKMPGNAITIVADVSDPGGVQDFYVDYRTGKGAWQQTAFNRGITPPSATIPDAAVTTDGIDYRIVASDLSGNTSVLNGVAADQFTPIVITVASDKFSFSTQGGTNQTDYRLFSVPVGLGDQKASHFFSGQNSLGINGTEWRLFRFIRTTGYDEWSTTNDFDLQIGHAYMLITSKSIKLRNTLGGALSLGYLRVPGAKLEPGWNIVGDFFPYQLALSDLELLPAVNNLTTSSFYYSGSGSQSGWDFGTSAGFRPWEGLAIHVTDTCFLKLKNPDAALQKLSTTGSDEPNSVYRYFQNADSALDSGGRDDNEWVGRIIASDDVSFDKITYFGVNTKVSEKNNAYVIYEPPAMPNTVSLFFPNPKSPDISDRLAADIRPSIENGLTWDLELRDAPHTMVRLELKNLQHIPSRYGVFLFDQARDALYDMRQQSFRDIYSADGTRLLELIVGERSYVTQMTGGVSTIPAKYALAQNYPNPFNPSTLIRYQIPEPGHVTLILYTIVGQEAIRLVDSDQPAGYYDVVVHASGLASGVYFYSLNVNGMSITKKMALVR